MWSLPHNPMRQACCIAYVLVVALSLTADLVVYYVRTGDHEYHTMSIR